MAVSTGIQFTSPSSSAIEEKFQGCLKENPVIVAQNISANTSRKAVKVNCHTTESTKMVLKRSTNEINPAFQRVFNVPLEKALTTVPSLNIQSKKNPAEKKRDRRKQLRQAKKTIEEHWKNTSVMRYPYLT